MKVAIVGATGNTGSSIVDGLLGSDTNFELTALVRSESLEKPKAIELASRGVNVVPANLQGSQSDLENTLKGFDVVISAIYYQALDDEIPLANAAKAAGVSRYVPCFFATAAPRGVMSLRDKKEEILDHINRIYLPYTVIDVGWWYQIGVPSVPSGRFDQHLVFPFNKILASGDISIAFTDLRDIGAYVAKIINDPGTINRKVFASADTKTQNQVIELVERLTGEKVEVEKVSATEIKSGAIESLKSKTITQQSAIIEYMHSWGVRGDNSPEYAKYLGYVNAHDLYPDLRGRTMEDFIKEML